LVARSIVLSGDLPLWNPFASLGLPLAAQYQPQLFFPFEWLEIALGRTSWDVLLIVKISLGGLGAYLLAANIVDDRIARTYAGVAYAFSPFLIWLHTVPAFVNGAVLVPWVFWAAHRAFRADIRLGHKVAVLSICSGLQWLTGQPQIAALTHCAVAVTAVVIAMRSWRLYRRNAEAGAAMIAAVVLGLVIAAPQLALFSQAIRHGYTLHSEGAYGGGGTAAMNLALPMFPFLPGQLMSPWNAGLFPDKLNWEAFPVLLGGAGAFLFALSLVLRVTSKRDDPRAAPVLAPAFDAFMLVVLASVLIVVLGTLDIGIWHGPIFNRINFPRYIAPTLSLGIAMVCAAGFASASRSSVRDFLVALSLVAAIVLGSLALLAPAFEASADRTYLNWSLLLGLAPPLITLLFVCAIAWTGRRQGRTEPAQWGILIAASGEFLFLVRYGLDLSDEGRRLVVLALVLSGAWLIAERRCRAGIAALCGSGLVLVAILWLADQKLLKSIDPYTEPPAYLRFLQSAVGDFSVHGRVLASQGTMIPNVANAFGIALVCSLNPVQVATTAQYIFKLLSSKQLNYTTPNAWPGVAEREGMYPTWSDFAERRKYYNLANVRFLVEFANKEFPPEQIPGIREIYRDSKVRIFEDAAVLPRAFVVTAARKVSSSKDAFDKVFETSFDARKVVIVEDPRNVLPEEISDRRQGQFAAASVRAASASRLLVEVVSPESGVLVLSDAFYSGWRAMVNGREASVLRVDGFARGVVVDRGPNTVVFEYRPRYLAAFFAASISAMLIALLLAAIQFRGRKNVSGQQKPGPA